VKVLLAIDGSKYSEMCAKTLKALKLSTQTEVTVMTVVPVHVFLGGLTIHMFRHGDVARRQTRVAQERKAAELVKVVVEMLRASGIHAESVVRWGKPAEQILNEAGEMRADLVVIGARGTRDTQQFPLGSVAQNVMKYAGASVLLVRDKYAKIRRVLLATDGSKYSDQVTRFLLDLPLPITSEVVLVTALQSHIAAWLKTPTMDLETNQQLLAELQEAEEWKAWELLTKTKNQFEERGYRVSSLVLKGEPAQEILLAASTINPDLIAVGAKGLTGVEAFLLGSVAQRVARFAKYSVLIGRVPGCNRSS
jgi:nucleotide-binding universal stress UspA family protein